MKILLDIDQIQLDRQTLQEQIDNAEQKLQALRQELQELDVVIRIAERRGRKVVPAPKKIELATKISAPTVGGGGGVRVGRPSKAHKRPTRTNQIISIIEELGRFLHKTEIEEELRKRGYEGASTTISGYLSNLISKGKLHVIKYGGSQNFYHYGLREWLGRSPVTGNIRFESPSRIPTMQSEGQVEERDIDWNLR